MRHGFCVMYFFSFSIFCFLLGFFIDVSFRVCVFFPFFLLWLFFFFSLPSVLPRIIQNSSFICPFSISISMFYGVGFVCFYFGCFLLLQIYEKILKGGKKGLNVGFMPYLCMHPTPCLQAKEFFVG